MSKYRIKIEKKINRPTKYIPQIKKFIFWFDMRDPESNVIITYDGDFSTFCPAVFETEEEARIFIRKYKVEKEKKKEYRDTYKYI